MFQTYELFLEDEQGHRSFETLLCKSVTDLLPKVRELIAARRLAAVQVCVGGEHLFTLST